MRRKAIPTGFPWLVIRPAGVDEYATEADARADANGGTVVHKSAAAAAPDLLALVERMAHVPMGDALRYYIEIGNDARLILARATGGAK